MSNRLTPSQIKRVRNCGHDVITDELGDILEIWTPSEIKSYIYNVATGYESLNNDIETHSDKIDPQVLTSWGIAYNGLLKFVEDYNDSSWFSRSGMGPVRASERFQTVLEGFRKKIKASGVDLSLEDMPKPPSDTGPFSFLSGIGTPLVIGGVVIGAILLFKK